MKQGLRRKLRTKDKQYRGGSEDNSVLWHIGFATVASAVVAVIGWSNRNNDVDRPTFEDSPAVHLILSENEFRRATDFHLDRNGTSVQLLFRVPVKGEGSLKNCVSFVSGERKETSHGTISFPEKVLSKPLAICDR